MVLVIKEWLILAISNIDDGNNSLSVLNSWQMVKGEGWEWLFMPN